MSHIQFEFRARVGPLRVIAPRGLRGDPGNPPVTEATLLRALCTPDENSELVALVARYDQIDVNSNHLFVAPEEPELLNKLVWPLRHAKCSYVLGNYLGTISLCGTVAEMLAILLFDVAEVKLNNRLLDEKGQVALFGSSFEKLAQERRVKILRAYGIINDTTAKRFDEVRLIRRSYLHLWSRPHSSAAEDAIAIHVATATLVSDCVIAGYDNGRLVINAAIIRYLSKQGYLRTPNADQSADA